MPETLPTLVGTRIGFPSFTVLLPSFESSRKHGMSIVRYVGADCRCSNTRSTPWQLRLAQGDASTSDEWPSDRFNWSTTENLNMCWLCREDCPGQQCCCSAFDAFESSSTGTLTSPHLPRLHLLRPHLPRRLLRVGKRTRVSHSVGHFSCNIADTTSYFACAVLSWGTGSRLFRRVVPILPFRPLSLLNSRRTTGMCTAPALVCPYSSVVPQSQETSRRETCVSFSYEGRASDQSRCGSRWTGQLVETEAAQ